MKQDVKRDIVCDCDVIHEEIVGKVRKELPEDVLFGRLADLYKMFADGTRAKLLWALSLHEMCICDLAVLLNMTKSAISHQLKSLRLTNLVKSRRDGKNVYYSLADSHVEIILKIGSEHIQE